MGSSSKKAKNSKEGSRKRRHRSRSNSDDSSREKDKERHRHRRHHKERRHDKASKHRDYDSEVSDYGSPSRERGESSPKRSESPTNNQSVESLSIDETNKLRAKLGLKPLELSGSSESRGKDKDDKFKDDLGEFYHKPAANLAEKTVQEKLRSKLSEKKEKRVIESKLSKIKTLGDSDSDEDAIAWIEKNRKLQIEKEQAAKRAKMLEELDEEFGIGDIVESETKLKKAKVYSDRHLRGLKVEHDVKNFAEGKSVILTLKDSDVLGEDGDVLVNVNLLDEERYEKNNELKKKKPQYHPYADEEFDEFGKPIEKKSLLSKYDEEIDGVKKSTFVIGESLEPKRSIALTVKEKLSNKRLESLVLPELNLASEYYTEEEMTKFKKPKKKLKKMRTKGKILTAAELAASVEMETKTDHGSRKRKPGDRKTENSNDNGPSKGEFTDWMDIDDLPEVKPIMEGMKVEPEDSNLERALHKARRLKQKEALTTFDSVESLIKSEPKEEPQSVDAGSIVLNSTAEFCRSLGDIPTYGKSGNRDEDEDLMDFDKDSALPEPTNSWNPVEASGSTTEAVVDPAGVDKPILGEEPDVGSGVGAALKLAMSKGYLDKEENNRPSTSKFAHLQARHYSIEDKTYGDDDKFGGRRERYSGPTLDFKEKDCFRPNVKLEYIDDEGRVLNPKEAFRYLSHKFHGKGPGKNKIEKRIKKQEQEGLMKKMSSTDTPLGTLNMLQHKQKEMQSPYIVLSGSKHTQTTTIAKARR